MPVGLAPALLAIALAAWGSGRADERRPGSARRPAGARGVRQPSGAREGHVAPSGALTAGGGAVPTEPLVVRLWPEGVPVEAHLYERGPLGFGVRGDLATTSGWVERWIAWMRAHGWRQPRSETIRCG